MAKVDPVVSAAGRLQHVVTELSARVHEKGVSLDDAVASLTKPEAEPGLRRISEVLISAANGTCGYVPPRGGRIARVTVPVDESRDWEDALQAISRGNPVESSTLYGPRRMGTYFPAQEDAKKEKKSIFLAYIPRAQDANAVLLWAAQQRLVPASPRQCFAIGEHKPFLRENLKWEDYLIVATIQSRRLNGELFAPAVVWWNREDREGLLAYAEPHQVWLNSDGIRHAYWFAFVPE